MKLTLVPTPIGNLKDITLRSIEVLKAADIILAEDTRVTGKLLNLLEIKGKMTAYHQHNEHRVTEQLVEQIAAGQSVALVTDAGTPAISDPGFFIVRACIENGIEVECLPGATAIIPALAVSGLPTERFIFEGFLPHKKGRATRLTALAEETRTIVFYESTHRIVKTLKQFVEFYGEERKVCICRELTKLHEEIFRGTVAEAVAHFENGMTKGEFVVVLGGMEA